MELNQKITIGLWIDNLMDRVRVGDILKHHGFDCQNISGTEENFNFLESNPQSLVILDLQNSSFNFESIQKQFEGHQKLLKRVICYFPHVQIQLKKNAESCGIEHIYPRSVFFKDTSVLIQNCLFKNR